MVLHSGSWQLFSGQQKRTRPEPRPVEGSKSSYGVVLTVLTVAVSDGEPGPVAKKL